MTIKNLVMEVKEILGKGYTVETKRVNKNNGVVLTGIVIRKNGESIGPTFYPDEYTTAQEIIDRYKSEEVKNGMEGFNVNNIDKDYVLANVIPVLYNRETNKELLETAVHIPCADLEIVFRVVLPLKDSKASFLINKGQFGLTEQELYDAAMANIQGKAEANDITAILTGLGEPIDLDDESIKPPMIVITNKAGYYGAGSILDKEIVAKIQKKLGDYYILPSSVHEVIVVPTDGIGVDSLVDMVREINRTEVSKNDFLSDNVYKIIDGELEVA